MPFDGDIGALGGMIAAINELARIPSVVSKPIAGRITGFLKRQFELGVDPYDKPLAPLKPSTLARGRHPPPLTHTGRTKAGTTAVALPGGGVGIEAGWTLKWHQFGRKDMAARKMIPEYGLPAKWRTAIKEALDAAGKRAMSRVK